MSAGYNQYAGLYTHDQGDDPGYANGGQIGMAPNHPQLGAAQNGGDDPQMDLRKINQYIQADPGATPKVAAAIHEALQSGEVTPQQLHQVIQLATACFRNPALWPNVRAFAIKSGICGPDDLPEQYDKGLVAAILTASRAAESSSAPAQQPQGGQPVQALANSGMIQGPGTGTSDSVNATNTSNGEAVKVSNGEYVVPADVVQAKGKDFFDAMVRKYHQPNGYQK